MQGYTGNGLTTIDGISGWSFGGLVEMTATGVPGTSGAYIPTSYLIKTVSTSNTINTFTFASTGNLTVPGTVGATLLTGALTTNAQPNITSVGTLSNVSVTGNVTAGNVYANAGTIIATFLTGTLTTNAQPNITSVGTLSSLGVTGNINIKFSSEPYNTIIKAVVGSDNYQMTLKDFLYFIDKSKSTALKDKKTVKDILIDYTSSVDRFNNTNFDTTIDNELEITVQWGSTLSANNIYSDLFVLNKVY
jgi:hypothetical protein